MTDTSRLTVDLPSDEHIYLKMISAKLHMTMKDFVLLSVFEKMETIEDEWLVERAEEILERVDSGEEEVVTWEEAKKRLRA